MLGSQQEARHCRDMLLESFISMSNLHRVSSETRELVNSTMVFVTV
jgi:hypothetical protein